MNERLGDEIDDRIAETLDGYLAERLPKRTPAGFAFGSILLGGIVTVLIGTHATVLCGVMWVAIAVAQSHLLDRLSANRLSAGRLSAGRRSRRSPRCD